MHKYQTSTTDMNMDAYDKLYGIEKNQIRRKSLAGVMIEFWLLRFRG